MEKEETLPFITEVNSLVPKLNSEISGPIFNWTDEKKKEYVKLLELRIDDTNFIIKGICNKIFKVASERYFIGNKSSVAIQELFPKTNISRNSSNNYNKSEREYSHLTSLTIDELDKIIDERANSIIQELPSSISVVRVILPETAKEMDKLSELNKIRKSKEEDLAEIPVCLDIDDFPDSMTIKEFKREVKNNMIKKRDLLTELNEIYGKIKKLQESIDKALYKGIPELEKAVFSTIKDLFEQSTAYGQLYRRLEERVRFGDSEAAISILNEFKDNEVNINENTKERIAIAVQKILKPTSSLKGKKQTKKIASKTSASR